MRTLFATAFALLFANASYAADFCAHTSQELASAINTAANNGQSDEIRVGMGVFIVPATGAFDFKPTDFSGEEGTDLTISGGWAGQSCTLQMKFDGVSVLDGINQRSIMAIHANLSHLDVNHLTFRNGSNFGDGVIESASLAVYSRATAVISHNVFKYNNSLKCAAGPSLSAYRSQITFRNNLVMNNESWIGYPGVYVNAMPANHHAIESLVLTFSNNTIADNMLWAEDGTSGVHIQIWGKSILYMHDNISFGNEGGGYSNEEGPTNIFVNGSPDVATGVYPTRSVHHNLFAPLESQMWDTNLFADPAFVGNGDYRLRPTSPAIGAGVNANIDFSYDLAGGPRVQFGIDIGAFESAYEQPLFSNGFD